MMNRLPLWLLPLVLLASCTQSNVRYDVGPGGAMVAGSQVQLNSEVQIAPRQARVFFQRGKMINKSQLDYYYPSCDIEVRRLSDEIQTVQRDTFTVTRVSSGQEQVVDSGGVKVAGFSWGVGSGWGGGGLLWRRGNSIHRYFRLDLHSEQQPDVMRLTCRGAWDDSPSARFPTSQETRIALGEYVTFL